jgi:hypothetical protein
MGWSWVSSRHRGGERYHVMRPTPLAQLPTVGDVHLGCVAEYVVERHPLTSNALDPNETAPSRSVRNPREL